MNAKDELESLFPNLRGCTWEITGPPDPNYNCIAWAVKWTSRPWWPNDFAYWPAGVPMEESIATFAAAFACEGFVPCPNAEATEGHEKIALFALNGIPKHAARQLPDGQWTSKLGRAQVITHSSLAGVAGEQYGEMVMYFQRPLAIEK